ncbi:bifunctional chorismate mutase/prephenate dehydrogenase [[Haemophilus] ducreyi]|uniref:bifunctional chorismate mutase/prephenate dehydrogenase n=1 Tax=Haemophilus ducreyi TaxID=730 RepID=UPI000655E05D|nr:bifunctional chorismate mutase/prephenate dehydrogenase [[Haemophilus] ducreyi]AKO47758.1 prephenate dehydrogenase [[Haemophilus] ducreyi]AKO49142.1 prephenate dehydrogenase [[Haemophilus] ducreyi]ANF62203.1 bifunctional chorismate mutase/prephenate dehydrogenase [[Haemophilus] ducreyi]ANF67143.1 bifunctional chorismate mutase/prephenate dehydrogenase [[Haemophilus] ducreyi]ANF68977.1 bifunctional chorismate mutase/prephenate dehydrogenase [[Haemophilus] ducreyi]
MHQLTHLRRKIDQIDQALIELLSERLKIVTQIGKVKYEDGLPIYTPDREATVLANCRQYAEKLGISSDFIEDILRRVMRESYVNENKFGFKKTNPLIKKIVIVGGRGKLGGLFGSFLKQSGYYIEILDQQDWPNAEQIIANSDVIIVCVPIASTLETLECLAPYLTPNMLLADLTSVKTAPLKKMLAVHRGAVIGLHPMFGPDIPNMAKQVVLYCPGRFADQYEWLLEQIRIWGAKIEVIEAEEHDQAMTYIQALRHFATFSMGLHLSKQPIQLSQLLTLSSPIYHLELAMVGRLFAQDGSLYADIISNKPENLAVLKSLQETYETSLAFFLNNDKTTFIETFNKVHKWFGDYSKQFLKESGTLLQKANDDW